MTMMIALWITAAAPADVHMARPAIEVRGGLRVWGECLRTNFMFFCTLSNIVIDPF